jgi:hypothetical protein
MAYAIVTKEVIFSRLSQEQIFERYFGVKVVLGTQYCSPLRTDKNPTGGFAYAKSGKLYFRDWTGHFFGDCIDFVRVMYNISFQSALEKIAADFDIVNGTADAQPALKSLQPAPLKKEPAVIQIASQPFQNWDRYYWTRHGVSSNTLKFFNTKSVKAIWLNGNRIYTYRHKDPAIAYHLGPKEYKIYFPERPKSSNRFICNTTIVQGWQQLPPKGELVVITKSMKDIIVLFQFGIRAVAWQGEGIVPDTPRVQELLNRFNSVVSLYDFDLTGIRTANKLRLLGVPAAFLTNGKCNTKNRNAKDPEEFVWRHGIAAATELANQFKNHYKNEYINRSAQIHYTRNAIQSA